ncbi:/ / hypothetical protein / 427013:427132 Reverse [Candidatus Hepatoplasma crinochetorum]|uniref:Uncharacterized protein n=1 Tax=Candidatus Hepatoplasma crinochetorum TaxID=295596 RepID=A0A0G7ZL97_9MOLU|nr:/ / hypothetical protein / 427013:427132 Reverse [Candidatus Hepatoplasma crinochetorum]
MMVKENFNEKYNVSFKKNGFHIIWNLNEETILLFENKLKINNLKFIFCHMKIWNKSFYEKHKKDKLNKDYNENEILNNIEKKIKRILIKNDFEVLKNYNESYAEKRIILRDTFKSRDSIKEFQYNLIFSHNINDNKIYMVTLYKKN